FAAPPEEDNSPWYPSLQAFEHYDSGRSHVFSQAEFLGSFHQPNAVEEVRSSELAYPSGYNMSYLNENEIFIQAGRSGAQPGSIGPFVAKVDPQTLEPVWFNQLRITKTNPQPMNREWDYPGGMAILNNGFIYVVSGYWIYKVNPEDGHLVKKLELPTTVYLRSNWPCNNPVLYESTPTDNALNTSYNGINALPDGTILLKSLYRQAGCNLDGPTAALQCPQFSNLPQSVLVTVNPDTLEIIDIFQLTAPAPARPTISRWRGVDSVYLVETVAPPRRYSVTNGIIKFDDSWQPPSVSDTYAGQQPGGSLIVMNEWIVGATNSVPATGALTVFAIHQDAAERSNVLWEQPFTGDHEGPGPAAAWHAAPPR